MYAGERLNHYVPSFVLLERVPLRGAVVKAMAICTRHPFIQIFKVRPENISCFHRIEQPFQPILLMALDDYFLDPSQDCLARLFDAINSMDLSRAPSLSRYEKIVMRSSERKDIFQEKFTEQSVKPEVPGVPATNGTLRANNTHKPSSSMGSMSSFEEGIMMRTRERAGTQSTQNSSASQGTAPSHSSHGGTSQAARSQAGHSPEDVSFSLGGSAVWVGDESVLDQQPTNNSVPSLGGSTAISGSGSGAPRGRRSTDASTSSGPKSEQGHGPNVDSPSRGPGGSPMLKDTHFFHTNILYKGHQLPIKLPLSTFSQEVGDVSLFLFSIQNTSPHHVLQYSLIQLLQTFSAPNITVSGPLHPHLHTNGNLTPPIILLFNGLMTGKRILFLGHGKPAGMLANFVLSACALASGCGIVLRGFLERAFPYATLLSKDDWSNMCDLLNLSTSLPFTDV